jgi:hypothetical protein
MKKGKLEGKNADSLRQYKLNYSRRVKMGHAVA